MTTRKAPAKRPQHKAPVFAKAQPRPQAKASTRASGGRPGVAVQQRIEVSLVKIGTLFSRSKTVNRAARGKKGAGGFFARLVQGASKALTKGAAQGLKAATGDDGGAGAESWKRFQESHPDSVKGGRGVRKSQDAEARAGAREDAGPACPTCHGRDGHHKLCPRGDGQ